MKIEVLYWPGLLGPDPHWLPEVRLAAGGDRGHGGGQRRGAGAGAVLYCTVLYRGALYCTVQVLYWWPHWRLRCTHAPCSLHTAHTVLATVTSNHCRSFPIYICF